MTRMSCIMLRAVKLKDGILFNVIVNPVNVLSLQASPQIGLIFEPGLGESWACFSLPGSTLPNGIPRTAMKAEQPPPSPGGVWMN